MRKAVIYARYSSDSQTEQSIEGQLRVCREYAQNNNILIVDTYVDRAMTGTNDNRAAFQKMLKDSSRKEWQFVLVVTHFYGHFLFNNTTARFIAFRLRFVAQ